MLIVWCFALLLCVLPSHKFLENVQARDFLMQKLYALRRPKTNIQILQQNVLLKYKYVATFLRTHGQEVFPEIRAAYVDTMNKVELLYSCSCHLVYCGQSGAGAGSAWE
jgi:hypothetical protein